MKHGFVKVAAATPGIRVADTKFNSEVIISKIKEAYEEGASLIVMPELCITGYTCQDLFAQDTLLNGAKEALAKIADETKRVEALVFVGLPLEHKGKLYNVAAALFKGEVLGFVPKRYIPMYHEAYEGRSFAEGREKPVEV